MFWVRGSVGKLPFMDRITDKDEPKKLYIGIARAFHQFLLKDLDGLLEEDIEMHCHHGV